MKKFIGDGLMQLKKNDILKGFIMSMLAVLVTWLGQAIQQGNFPMDAQTWILELKIALGAGIAYLIKNFFTNSNDQFLKKEQK